MCSFVGFCDINHDISSTKDIETLKVLSRALSHRAPDEEDLYISKHANLGHRRLVVINLENSKQPMSCKYDDNIYTIVYNGKLYNSKDIRDKLINLGYEFNRLL